MKVFDLPEGDVRRLVAAVRGDVPAASVPDAFARMAWTVLIEPGDQIAGQLLDALGPARALETLIAGDPTPAIDVWLGDGFDPAKSERIATEAFARWRPRLVARHVIRAIEHAAALGLDVVVPHDTAWPPGLASLGPAAPVALWVRGSRDRLAALPDAIAIVGARAATGYGEFVATEIAGDLAMRDIGVVSGGAYGIDAAAHRAALAAEGVTIAFLAGGLDRYYPAGNSDLLARVAASGAVLAEVPPGTAPTKVRFLTRNRLLAAASCATVVVEAGVRSGSLNTAHHALAIGRSVGVVPGPVTSPASAGCHRLLRESDVVCVTSAADVVELIGGESDSGPERYEPTDPSIVRVLDSLGVRGGSSVDAIARSSGMSVGEVLAVLAPLELAGVVGRTERGWVRVPGLASPPHALSGNGGRR